MKEFFKYFLASLLSSIILFFIGVIIFCIIVFGVIGSITAKITNEHKEKEVLDESHILLVDLSTPYPDKVAYENFDFGFDDDEHKEAIDLYDVQKAIQHAITDKNIKGIYIKAHNNVNSLFVNEAIRAAIQDFKIKSKKPVIAYAENFIQGQGAYYVASVADSIYMGNTGVFDWRGLGIEMIFYKKLMENIGINMQIFYAGKYKSATEPFREEKMTPYNKEQLSDILNTAYEKILEDVSQSRHIEINKLKDFANNLSVTKATQAQQNHFITRTAYYNEVVDELKNIATDNNAPALIGLKDYTNSINKKQQSNKIAVVYMEGMIAQGDNNISAKKFRKIFKDIKENSDIKAVVLRINSPGGSGDESEAIWKEIQLLKKEKPVLVSMGAYAASGGYYIASAADNIFAMPFTLTGSIGVFGMIPNINQVAHKIGITTDQISTAPHANLSVFGLDNTQKNMVQQFIEDFYTLFKIRVAESRKKTIDQVEVIAQGRVWTGLKAKEKGLIDGLADLDSCIKIVAHKANIQSYSTVEYPKPLSWVEKIKYQFKGYLYSSIISSFPILNYLNADKNALTTNILLQEKGKPMLMLPFQIEIQ